MSLSKLGVFANLALAATAVLLPPGMTAADLGDANVPKGLHIDGQLVDPYKRSVALECPSCAFATLDEQGMTWKEDVGNTFNLNFQIGQHENTFETNTGYQLFPPNNNDGKVSFFVSQVTPGTDEALSLAVTSYTFRYEGARTISEQGIELLPMTLQIHSLEGVKVDPPMLTINLLKDSHGGLIIASFGTMKTPDTSFSGHGEDCNEWPLLCKWKDIVAERIEKMKKMGKGCHKRPHGHHNPMEEETMEGKPPHRFHHGRPHHRPHHMGHGHHSQHRMHTFARRAFFTIFIPIIVGIFAGTVTYLIGMVLGTVIAIIIAKVRGQEYQRIALEENVEEGEAEVKVHSEKQEYAELPAYEAPPVYEDAPEKEVNESK